MDAALSAEPTIAQLNQKIDFLTEQLAFVTEELRQQQRRRQEWEELQADATPIINDVFRLATEQLEELDESVQLEDILHLFKRLLRNTRNLEQMLDQLENVMELWQDFGPLSRDAFFSLMNRLDEMERKGYFVFLEGGLDITDRIVTAFTEEDVRLLGDNIVLIVETIKQMTQPEIMTMLQSTVLAIETEPDSGDISLLKLMGRLRDPAVKRGFAKTLNALKSVGQK